MEKEVVIGQKRVLDTLARLVDAGRVPHALLFYGPDGVGKRAVALELAAALQCENVNGGRACDQCGACGRIRKMGHPDVHFMMPVPKDTPVASVTERLQRIGGNPYATVDFGRRPSLDTLGETSNRQVVYSVERISLDLRKEMSFKSVEGGYRIAILTDADRMRVEAANAFLKMLEEPGERTVFILTTDRPERLLTTVRSRCQMIRFERLTTAEITEALTARTGMDRERAESTARMADGSFARALDLSSSEDLFSLRQEVLDYLRATYRSRPEDIFARTDRIQRMGREKIKFFLQLMLSWLRDLLIYREVGEDGPIINQDQLEAIDAFYRNLPAARIETMVALVEEAHELVGRNQNLRLIFIVLAMSLGRAMRGEHVRGIIVSLSEETELV